MLSKKASGQSWAQIPMTEMLKIAFFSSQGLWKIGFFLKAFFIFSAFNLFVCVNRLARNGKMAILEYGRKAESFFIYLFIFIYFTG